MSETPNPPGGYDRRGKSIGQPATHVPICILEEMQQQRDHARLEASALRSEVSALREALAVADDALARVDVVLDYTAPLDGGSYPVVQKACKDALARIRAARQGTDSERRGVVNTPDAVPERPSAEESQVANPAGAPPSSPAPPPAERTCPECGGKRRVYGRYRETGICAWFDCPGCTGRSPVAEGGERE